MSVRPILFSAPMIRALLTGTRKKLYAPSGKTPLDREHLARRLVNGLSEAPDIGCWEWTKATNNHGYGTLTVSGRAVYAHRLAYTLGVGPIQDGMKVLHRCDNPRCIRPDHLFLGTQSDNMADCHKKGRSRIPTPRVFGERNGSAKLTVEQVSEIRRRASAGEVQRLIAADFGISQSHVSAIKRGRLWA